MAERVGITCHELGIAASELGESLRDPTPDLSLFSFACIIIWDAKKSLFVNKILKFEYFSLKLAIQQRGYKEYPEDCKERPN
jgi:hypothetical protein